MSPEHPLLALFDRAAAALRVSADLADQHAALAGRHGDEPDAAEGERARRARASAENGPRAARRLHLRRQADALLRRAGNWAAGLAYGAAPAAVAPDVRLPVLDVAVIGTNLAGIVAIWNPAAERLFG